jgi:hypothetical protein
MVDAGIKQIRIKKSEFPLVQFTTTYNDLLSREEVAALHYDFRYRVVSEDKNRSSHWSEIIRYPMPDVTTPFPFTATNRFSISDTNTTDSKLITAVWSFPGDSENPSDYVKFFRDTTQYDVWIRWNNNNTTDLNDAGWTLWEYEATISSNSFSILKKDGDVKRIEIAVQVPTTLKVRDYYNNKLTLFRGLSGTI